MDFPGSPYYVLERLLEEYRSGQRSPERVAQDLETFDLFLQQWSEGVMALPVEPEVLPEGPETIEGSMQGLECFAEASACFRDYLETGDDGLAEQAMELARQGHDTLAHLLVQTARRVDELQNEIG
jgi:hypothetical protein